LGLLKPLEGVSTISSASPTDIVSVSFWLPAPSHGSFVPAANSFSTRHSKHFPFIFGTNHFKIGSVSLITLLLTEFDKIFCDISRHGVKRKSGSASRLVKSWRELAWILMFYKILILMLYANVNSETAAMHFPRYCSEYRHAVGAPLLRSRSLPPVLLS
jgi:hypothetical protein